MKAGFKTIDLFLILLFLYISNQDMKKICL